MTKGMAGGGHWRRVAYYRVAAAWRRRLAHLKLEGEKEAGA